jgi:hypothetical protein
MSLQKFISDVEMNRAYMALCRDNLKAQCDQRMDSAKKMLDEKVAEAKRACEQAIADAQRHCDDVVSQETALKQAIGEEFIEFDRFLERMIVGDSVDA